MQRLMLPLVIGIAFSQLSLIVGNIFASTLADGSISALSYSKKLVEMPIIVLPYALGVVIFPFFSELAISGEKESLLAMLMNTVKLLAFLFVPMAVGMIVLREPLVRLLFERGAFTSYSTHLTSVSLLYYALGLFSFAVEAVLVQFYFAMADTRTPVIVGVLCVLLNIMVTLVLISPLAHGGIALALTISKTVKVLALYGLLRQKLSSFRPSAPIGFLLRIVAAALIMGTVIRYCSGKLETVNQYGTLWETTILAGTILLGVSVFIAAAFAMRVREMKSYWEYLRRNVTRVME
jgi:murein biosynthesis integral membrane protein MurJ